MAKVKRPAALGPGQVPFAPAGVVFRDTGNGLVAQQLPKKRLDRSKPYQFYREREFAWAGKFASNCLAIDYATAVEMVKGTTMVPRDFLTQCMFGRAYIIEGGGYTNWPNYRDVTNNPQYVLELLDPDVGAIISRDPIGWVARPPGQEGYVLTMAGGVAQWRPAGGGGGAGVRWVVPTTYASNATSNNARVVRLELAETVEIDACAIWYARTSGQVLGLRIFEAVGNTLGPLVRDCGEITVAGSYTGDVVWNLSPALVLEGGKDYTFVHFGPDETVNYRLNTFMTQSFWTGILQKGKPQGGFIATNDPVEGMTHSTSADRLAIKFRVASWG